MKAHFEQRESQQTAQLNEMSRRLAVAGAAVSHARAAVEAKMATQTAAVESEYRRQVGFTVNFTVALVSSSSPHE